MTALCKKQTCVSHSSTEAEIVAAEYATRTEGLQIPTFWDQVTRLFTKRPVKPKPTDYGLYKDSRLKPYSGTVTGTSPSSTFQR